VQISRLCAACWARSVHPRYTSACGVVGYVFVAGRQAFVKGGPGWHPLLPRKLLWLALSWLVLLVTLFSKLLTMLYLNEQRGPCA